MVENITRPVWAKVNLTNIKYNFKQVQQSVSPETLIMAVVKADAYGHGVLPVARSLVEAGADRLAVALPEEGIELRDAGFTLPIQVLGEVLPPQVSLLLDYNLIPTISKKSTVEMLNRLARERKSCGKVHIKVDTGMGRIGIQPGDTLKFIKETAELSNIEIEGIMTHFARADEMDKEYTFKQWNKFKTLISRLRKFGIKISIKQAANSAAIIDLPETEYDLVRPGIMLYGLPPSPEVDLNFQLKPALSWKARIVYLKELPPGRGISYGATYVTRKKTKIATIPLGYADGYSRLLSNKAEVLINGQRAPVTGTICMDQFMVDVTDIPDVKVGDEVVLIGKQGEDEITATELADLIGTINYEITCNIKARIPRIHV